MFKVESSSTPSAGSALSINPQGNFDFGLSFCDDGTNDDLFESLSAPSSGGGGGGNNNTMKVEPGISDGVNGVDTTTTRVLVGGGQSNNNGSPQSTTPMDTDIRIKQEPVEDSNSSNLLSEQSEKERGSPGTVSSAGANIVPMIESTSLDTTGENNGEASNCVKKGKPANVFFFLLPIKSVSSLSASFRPANWTHLCPVCHACQHIKYRVQFFPACTNSQLFTRDPVVSVALLPASSSVIWYAQTDRADHK